jgi:hypothetical protein
VDAAQTVAGFVLCLASLAVVAALLGAMVAFSRWVDRRNGLPILTRYVVTLTTGEAFDGLLESAEGGVLRLVEAYAVDESSRVKVDGAVYLDRSKVAYMQQPGGGQ